MLHHFLLELKESGEGRVEGLELSVVSSLSL